ncbi:hypothetical protein DSUL_80090 [Desulfovibrionales bacterium]
MSDIVILDAFLSWRSDTGCVRVYLRKYVYSKTIVTIIMAERDEQF